MNLMKRIVIICLLVVFLSYALIILSSLNFLGIRNIPYLKKALSVGRKFTGIGPLFTREATLDSYSTSYRFYQDGRWQNWQWLEKPLFNDYINHGNIASLKHARLDLILSQHLYFLGFKKHPLKNLENTVPFQSFIRHLFHSHNQNRTPDSLQIKYIRKSILNSQKSVEKELLNYKCKP